MSAGSRVVKVMPPRGTAAGSRSTGICAATLPRDRRDGDRRLARRGTPHDLAAIAARLARGHPLVQRASWRTYDQFLKANRVDDGVKSYDEVVTLILGTAADADGRPRAGRLDPLDDAEACCRALVRPGMGL